ncbi:terminase small subunit [Paraburkholderia sp. Ac-20340]|uniref:terminase small subunit n=1 Tax=Paraburkholderia sp. Ac-20340 TaxID=2703888 RepID=UPI0019816813|nr:terminase small subunit [Paraburkholderia sp. Ac-20340]MBN3853819.1 terminase small subunit [Paraburkholderia sp. Ac-20340]
MKRESRPPLSEKHQRFIGEYLIDLNATQAAIRAGYSAATAYSQGQRLLKHVEVAKAIRSEKKARADRMRVTQDRVLLEVARIAFFDPRKLFNSEGAPIPINQLDDDTAAALAGVEVLEEYEGSGEERRFIGYTKKYKVADKNTALTNAMRHLGMLKDSLNLNLPPGGALVRVEFVDPPEGVPAAKPEVQTDG